MLVTTRCSVNLNSAHSAAPTVIGAAASHGKAATLVKPSFVAEPGGRSKAALAIQSEAAPADIMKIPDQRRWAHRDESQRSA